MTPDPRSAEALQAENAELRAQLSATLARLQETAGRLDEARETLRAIRGGEVVAAVAGRDDDGTPGRKDAGEPYRVLIEEMSDGAAALSAEGLVLYANRRFVELVGAAQEHVVGMPIGEFVAEAHRTRLAGMLATGRVDGVGGELRLRSPDDMQRPLHVSLSRMPPDSEAAFSLIAVDLGEQHARELEIQSANVELQAAREDLERHVADRTSELAAANEALRASRAAALNMMQDAVEAKEAVERARAELLESREDLNQAQAVAHIGSWRLDARRDEVIWSDENYRIYGVDPGTPLTYDTFLETVHPDDAASVRGHVAAALHGEPYDIEHRIVVDGESKWVREQARLEFDENGGLIGGLGTTQDITERRAAEEALRESERRHRELAAELAVERGTLAAAIEEVDIGVILVAPDGSFLSMNAMALALHGIESPADMPARLDDFAEVFDLHYPDGRPMPAGERPIQRTLNGEHVHDFEAHVCKRHGGHEWIGAYSSSPVRDAEGNVVLYVVSIYDLTDRRRLEQAVRSELETSRLLLQTSSVLAEWTDPEKALQGLVDLAAHATDHSRILLYVWNEVDRRLELTASAGSPAPPTGTRATIAHLPGPGRGALRERRSRLVDLGRLSTPERGRAYEQDGLLALLAPLLHRDRLVGLLAIDEPGERRPFTERQRRLVEGIASQAAVAIENARLYEAQRHIATTLQEQFLHPAPRIPGLEFAVMAETAYAPELVGGDFHDVFELPHGLVAILIGDVEGKGIAAAALSETVRSAVRALAIVSPSPRYILNNVNRLLMQEHSEQYATALLTIIDPVDGLALSASAGHPAPVLVKDGAVSIVSMRFGVPLGALPWDHEQASFRLSPGDSLIVYTDGISEARRGDTFFGEEGVAEVAASVADRPPEEIARAIRDAAAEFAFQLRDDLQLVVTRFVGRDCGAATPRPPSRLNLAVPDAPWRLADIRGSVRDFLRAHDIDTDMSDDLVLCVEEACTNALLHSCTEEPVEVWVAVDAATVEISVRDHGIGIDMDSIDLERLPDPMSPGGRGLYLMRAVVDEMELTNDGGAVVRLRRYRVEDGRPAGRGAVTPTGQTPGQ